MVEQNLLVLVRKCEKLSKMFEQNKENELDQAARTVGNIYINIFPFSQFVHI